MVHSSLAHSIRTLWRDHFRCLKILNISPRQPRVKHDTWLRITYANLAGAACDISEPTEGKTLHFATALSEIPEL